MYRLSEVLILDLILFILSMLFGMESAFTVLILEIFGTLAWIANRLN